jgi:hypothetical protein
MSDDLNPAAQEPTEPAEATTPAEIETPDVEESTLLGQDPEFGKDGQKQEDAEAGEGENVVPEKYDIKVPDGMEIDVGTMERFTPVFKEMGFTQDQVQKLADVYAPIIQERIDEFGKSLSESYKKQVSDWKTESEKALGAEKTQKMALAAKAINQIGTPELRAVLDETGIGNHVELVKFFVKVGEIVSEDKFVDSSKTYATDSEEARMKRMYPSMT